MSKLFFIIFYNNKTISIKSFIIVFVLLEMKIWALYLEVYHIHTFCHFFLFYGFDYVDAFSTLAWISQMGLHPQVFHFE